MCYNKQMIELELLEKHKNLVKIIARSFSGDPQDNFQEGLIALLKAIQTYKTEEGVKFETYASKVIKNRLIDITRKEKEATAEYNDNHAMTGTIEDEYSIIEKSAAIKKIINEECTPVEKAVFNSYARGLSYTEISKIFDINKKKIDNTIQKVRYKIRTGL